MTEEAIIYDLLPTLSLGVLSNATLRVCLFCFPMIGDPEYKEEWEAFEKAAREGRIVEDQLKKHLEAFSRDFQKVVHFAPRPKTLLEYYFPLLFLNHATFRDKPMRLTLALEHLHSFFEDYIDSFELRVGIYEDFYLTIIEEEMQKEETERKRLLSCLLRCRSALGFGKELEQSLFEEGR